MRGEPLWVGQLVWGYDPQNAPEFYTHVVERLTSDEGVEFVVLEDQDGEQFAVDLEEYRDPLRA